MDSKNLLLAAALAGLTMTVGANEAAKKDTKPAEAQAVEGQCHGVNSCKGTSACHSDQNGCAGKNSCKGKGWMKMSEKECKDKKGTFKKA